MKIIISIGVIAFSIFGILLSLISMYASPDEKIHIFEASMFYLSSSIVIAGLLYYLKNNVK